MKLIPISKYDYHTMQLAKPVVDSSYRMLLAAGHAIHPKYLERLKALGISHLIVEDRESRGITLEEMLDMSIWMETVRELERIYTQVKKENKICVHSLKKLANNLVREVKYRKVLIVAPSTIISRELLLYAHLVNVTLLSLMVGKALMYTDIQLRELAVGCLLHDLGKIFTDREAEHPQAGFEFIRKEREINLLSAHVAFQHHETLDGSGYPRKMRGEDILEFAQICGLTNLYENMISRENVPPHEAMEYVMTLHGRKYVEHVVKAFCSTVPTYPPGSKVYLHSEEKAIVTKITSHIYIDL